MSVDAGRCRVLGAPKGEAFYVSFLTGFKHTQGQCMLVCVCVCVCVCARARARIYIYMYICTNAYAFSTSICD